MQTSICSQHTMCVGTVVTAHIVTVGCGVLCKCCTRPYECIMYMYMHKLGVFTVQCMLLTRTHTHTHTHTLAITSNPIHPPPPLSSPTSPSLSSPGPVTLPPVDLQQPHPPLSLDSAWHFMGSLSPRNSEKMQRHSLLSQLHSSFLNRSLHTLTLTTKGPCSHLIHPGGRRQQNYCSL